MGDTSPSEDLLHMWVVLGFQYGLGSLITWTITYKLLRNLPISNKMMMTSIIDGSTDAISLIVCIGYSLALPLLCVQMFFISIKYDNKTYRDMNDTEYTLTDNRMIFGFGLTGNLGWFAGSMGALWRVLCTLDIFDRTVSEMSSSGKIWYRRLYYLVLILCVSWLICYPFNSESHKRIHTTFAIISILLLLFGAGFQLTMAVEFATRIVGYLENIRHRLTVATASNISLDTMERDGNSPVNNMNSIPSVDPSVSQNREIIGFNGEGLSPDSTSVIETKEFSYTEQTLMSNIVKQSMLSVILLGSLIVNGLIFILSLNVSNGILVCYINIMIMQSAVVIPLCVYLSFDFARNEYHWFCERNQRKLENRVRVALSDRAH